MKGICLGLDGCRDVQSVGRGPPRVTHLYYVRQLYVGNLPSVGTIILSVAAVTVLHHFSPPSDRLHGMLKIRRAGILCTKLLA